MRAIAASKMGKVPPRFQAQAWVVDMPRDTDHGPQRTKTMRLHVTSSR